MSRRHVLAAILILAAVSRPASAEAASPVFDFSPWELQTFSDETAAAMKAVSSADLKAGYQDMFFKPVSDTDGRALAFFTPDKGTHSPNSMHPRSELRELALDGKSLALWDAFDERAHVLSAALKVTDAPHAICIGQVHADAVLHGEGPASVKPLLELYYQPDGTLVVGFQRHPNTGGQDRMAIGLTVPLGQKFAYSIAVMHQTETVSVSYGGTKKTVSQPIPSSFRPYGQYFKAGNYNQTDIGGDGLGTRDQFYSLSVEHK